MKSSDADSVAVLCWTLKEAGSLRLVAGDVGSSEEDLAMLSVVKVGFLESRDIIPCAVDSILAVPGVIGEVVNEVASSVCRGLGLDKIGGGEGHRKLEIAWTAGGISWTVEGSGEALGVDFFRAEESTIYGTEEAEAP